MPTDTKADVPRFDTPCENTDRHLWPLVSENADADSIHVTKGGGIGINVGGHVIVLPLREWHALALRSASQAGGVPAGAIDNGRELLRRLTEFYSFECDGGTLANCAEFQDFVRCFEHMAEWISAASPPPPATDGALREALNLIHAKYAACLTCDDDAQDAADIELHNAIAASASVVSTALGADASTEGGVE